MSESEKVIIQLVKEGYFTIDSLGRIWRCQTRGRTGKLRNIAPVRADTTRLDGYSVVRVYINKKEYCAFSHRIVWTALNGPIPDGLEINHKNGKRSDNKPSNLELVTKSENLYHAYQKLGRFRAKGERNGRSKLTRNQVREIRHLAKCGESRNSLSRKYNVSPTLIRRIINGVLWRDEFPQQGDK